MMRLWIGVGLLLALLLGSLTLCISIVPFHEKLAEDLDQAATLAAEGNWTQAQELAFAAQKRWQRHKNSIAAVTDHEPIEQMHTLFRELRFLSASQAGDFACLCIHLSETARAISETQALKWWGVL